MTVAEIFREVSLSPDGPLRWGNSNIDECGKGVYVVARVEDPTVGCKACDLKFTDPHPPVNDRKYELRRWFRNEPVLYIGQTTRSLRKRIKQFYDQEVGKKGPHAGGQVVKLLDFDLWVYWSATPDPVNVEKKMISVFKKQVGKPPFANGERGKPKRIRCSN